MGGPPGEPGRLGPPPSRRWGSLRHYQPGCRPGGSADGGRRADCWRGWPADVQGWLARAIQGRFTCMLPRVRVAAQARCARASQPDAIAYVFFLSGWGGPPVSPVRVRDDTAGRRHPPTHPGAAARRIYGRPAGGPAGRFSPGSASRCRRARPAAARRRPPLSPGGTAWCPGGGPRSRMGFRRGDAAISGPAPVYAPVVSMLSGVTLPRGGARVPGYGAPGRGGYWAGHPLGRRPVRGRPGQGWRAGCPSGGCPGQL